MSTRSCSLDLDSYQSEQQDLPRTHCRIPHRAANAIGVSECAACEQRRRPCPRADDATGDEARLYGARCCIKFFGLLRGVCRVAILNVCDRKPADMRAGKKSMESNGSYKMTYMSNAKKAPTPLDEVSGCCWAWKSGLTNDNAIPDTLVKHLNFISERNHVE